MILSKNINTPESSPAFQIGEEVHHITDGGRSFRLATVIHNKGSKIGIRRQDGTETHVWPWNLRRVGAGS